MTPHNVASSEASSSASGEPSPQPETTDQWMPDSPDSNELPPASAAEDSPQPDGLLSPPSSANLQTGISLFDQLPGTHMSYVDIDIRRDDCVALLSRQVFPLVRPATSGVGRVSLAVPERIYELEPRVLLGYDVQQSPHASNVWPDRRPAAGATVKYTPYPLPENMQPDEPFPRDANLRDYSWIHHREAPYLHSPPVLPAGLVTATAMDRVPQEIFDMVGNHLSQNDLKALRLTSRMMNLLASENLFHTVVVPFRGGIFSEEIRAELRNYTGKGKGKSMAINIFKSHGHQIKKFGLSFEVTEDHLANISPRRQHDLHDSYWGSYLWPRSPSHRDEKAQDLESAAEDLAGMKEAFSELTGLRELALSIDSGLGWLAGPDKSIQSQIIHSHIPLFPSQHSLPIRKTQAQRELWKFIRSHLFDVSDFRLFRLERPQGDEHPRVAHTGIPDELQFIDRRLLTEATPLTKEQPGSSPRQGYLVCLKDVNCNETCTSHPIQPNNLTQDQLEMLLDTTWAQQSFLVSYVIGVIDSEACRAVASLNLACLPGRFLAFFNRGDFWDSLPCLKSLEVMIMGEFRTLEQDEFEAAQSRPISPSSVAPDFRSFLVDHIRERASITTLTIGWASGGEQAEGTFNRNRHLLPAPFLTQTDLAPSPQMMDDLFTFPHVQHFTLANCWMTGGALQSFVRMHEKLGLAKLTLNSVSLVVLPTSMGGAMPSYVDPPPRRFTDPTTGGTMFLSYVYREGSWPQVLDAISPGAHLGHYNVGTMNPRKPTSLTEIELISCGHNVLESHGWGLDTIDRAFFMGIQSDLLQNGLNGRRATLSSLMTKAVDSYLGRIAQTIPDVERHALTIVWDATHGWEDFEAEYAVVLDGLSKGGSGRFSAVIRATKQ